jgi:hypothetical protein
MLAAQIQIESPTPNGLEGQESRPPGETGVNGEAESVLDEGNDVPSRSRRLFVNSHWSTHCHTRFLGVVPVGVSGCAPCSAKAFVAFRCR